MHKLHPYFSLLAVGLAACQRTDGRAAPATDYSEAALRNPRFTWDSLPSNGFTLYTKRNGYGAVRATQYRDEVAAALQHDLKMLGEPQFSGHVRVLVLESREDVEAVTGTGTNGWGDAVARTFGVVARAECRPVFRHEAMHVVSLGLWGNPLGLPNAASFPEEQQKFEQGGWLREGLAAAAENLYGNYSYRGMAASWQAEGTLLSLDSLVNAFYRQDDLAAYLQSGSLVQYLLEQHGSKRFREIWREGPSAFSRVYGKSATEIESDWQAWLRETPIAARPKSIEVARSEDLCPKRRK